MWLIILGLLVFLGLEIASESKTGAIIMGIGVLMGVLTMILRLASSSSDSQGQEEVVSKED